GLYGIVDIKQPLVRREAQPVRLLEQMAIDQKSRLAAARRNAIDALKAELARTLNAIDRHAAIPWIREIDRAGGMHAHVVGTVELLSLEVRRKHLASTVRPLANQ